MEFPLFETLAIEHGNILHIERHQQRYDRSLQAFYGDQSAVVFPNVFSPYKKALDLIKGFCISEQGGITSSRPCLPYRPFRQRRGQLCRLSVTR